MSIQVVNCWLGQGGAPPGPGPYPLPTTPPFNATGLKYWFAADYDTHSDVAGMTPCTNGGSIANWGNQGTEEDAVQNTSGNRPIWRTGGLNGRPYIECDGSQWFEDLLELDQPSGITGWTRTIYAIVTDQVDVSDGAFRSIVAGPGLTRGGKSAFNLYNNGSDDVYLSSKQNNIHAIIDSNGARLLSQPNIIVQGRGTTATQFHRKINDTAHATATHGTNVSPTTANSTTAFLRGGGGASTGPFKGRLYEFIAWHATTDWPDSTTFNAIFDYLNDKYDIFP